MTLASAPAATTPAADGTFSLIINGDRHCVDDAHAITLLALLRDRLGLTGTKEACGRGECGACTVLIDGIPQLSCIKLAVLVDGAVTTIEGLAEDWRDLREAFAEHGGFQCGFCTPGMILAAKALLDENPSPTEEELKHFMHGNICRCTGYKKIIESIMAAAKKMRGAN